MLLGVVSSADRCSADNICRSTILRPGCLLNKPKAMNITHTTDNEDQDIGKDYERRSHRILTRITEGEMSLDIISAGTTDKWIC